MKERKMKKSLRAIGGIAAVTMVLSACSNGNGAPVKTPASSTAQTSVEITPLVKKPLPQIVKLPAQLASFEQVAIFPKVNGYVKDVFVDVGSHVKKGQLL